MLTRIVKVKEVEGPIEDCESLAADEQWSRVVELEVVPHPGVRFAPSVEADYAMEGGVLRLHSRAALAGYTLRRWSIDCSPDHTLDPASHHLWLRNTQALNGVASAPLAPGFKSPEPVNAEQACE